MPLSDLACKNAKPAEKDQKLSDGGGLYLLVRPTGSKLWRINYRFQGKQKTLSVGAYPLVTLAKAREARDSVKKLLIDGIDPSAKPDTNSPDTNTAQVIYENTFFAVANDWFERRKPAWKPSHYERIWSRLKADVFPALGEKDVREITPTEALAVIRAVEKRGAFGIAKKVRAEISAIMRYAIAEGKATYDPAASLGDAMASAPPEVHNAILRAAQVGPFLRRLDAEDGPDLRTKLAIKLVMHTFVRTAEIRFGTWAEIDGDVWRIPAAKMKMGKEHIVPLTRQSLAILDQLKELKDTRGGDLIAPGDRPGKPMSENTMLFGLYRLGYKGQLTTHGLRGTASTILNESGLFRPDWIERQLAHVPGDAVRSAYNAAEYLAQRRKMMEWWSDWLDAAAVPATEAAGGA